MPQLRRSPGARCLPAEGVPTPTDKPLLRRSISPACTSGEAAAARPLETVLCAHLSQWRLTLVCFGRTPANPASSKPTQRGSQSCGGRHRGAGPDACGDVPDEEDGDQARQATVQPPGTFHAPTVGHPRSQAGCGLVYWGGVVCRHCSRARRVEKRKGGGSCACRKRSLRMRTIYIGRDF